MVHPKKWALISKRINGRTQHYVKNRFFVLLSKELNMNLQKTREFLKKVDNISLIKHTLENLKKDHIFSEISEELTLPNENNSNDEVFNTSFDNALEILFGKKGCEKVDNFDIF